MGAAAVAAVAAGIVTFKQSENANAATGKPAAVVRQSSPAALKAQTGTSVLLVADPGEAEASCGCGQIIRLVRAAGQNGVLLKEIAPGASPEFAQRYKFVVAPTVLILDARGEVLKRYEGEGSDTIKAMQEQLALLVDRK